MKLKKLYALLLALPLLAACGDDNEPAPVPEPGDPEEVWTENYHYKLPVVFHLLYASEGNTQQNPSQETLNTILRGVNQLYASCGVDMNLEFVMAEKDPDGNVLKEPGIDRVGWTTSTIDYQQFMNGSESRYLEVLWDQNRYINIVLYTFGGSTGPSTQGISQFPYLVAPAALDGIETLDEAIAPEQLKKALCVSINNVCIGYYQDDYTTFDKEKYDARDIVVTLAHELGHYLGLYHAFSTDDSCEDTDYCDDTPVYNRTKYNQKLGQYTSWEAYAENYDELVWRTDCNGQKFQSDNIMDYAVSSRNRFTEKQRERVRYILDNAILMPGPKKPQTEEAKLRTRASAGKVDVPFRFSE